MSFGNKTSLSLQKGQPKVIKPGNFGISSTWNPNAPKLKTNPNGNFNNFFCNDDDDEIGLRFRNEDIFDEIMDKMLNVPIEQAFEGPLQRLFNCALCIFWIDNPNDMTLYSPSRKVTVSISNSIVGYARLTRSIFQIENQSQCPPNFIINSSIGIQENCKHIFFPISSVGVIYGVIQIIRNPDMPAFSVTDLDSITFIMKKFSLIGNCIFNTSHLCDMSLQFFQKKKQPTLRVLDIIENYFQCKSAELWKYESNDSSYFLFDRQTNTLNQIENNEFGIIGQSLSKSYMINEKNASENSSFYPPFDGNIEGPILVVPYEKTKREIWCLALRGRNRSFNVYDEREVMSLMPFIVRCAMNCSSMDEDTTGFLTSLLEAASKMMCCLNSSQLFDLILRQSIQLIDCEKAVILLSDENKESFIRPPSNGNRLPIDKGLSGLCFKEKKILNIVNPKSDKNFCEEVDCPCPELDPAMALLVPLLSLHDEAAGVLTLYNKNAADKFSENDEKVAKAFAVFAGIAIENANYYRQLSDFQATLVQAADDLLGAARSSQDGGMREHVKEVLSKLTEKALDVTFCDRITLFTKSESDEFSPLINVGSESCYGTLYMREAVDSKAPLFVSSDRLPSKSSRAEKYRCRDRSSVRMNGRAARALVSGILAQKQPPNFKGNDGDEVMYEVPIMDDQLSIVGVVEYSFNNGRSEFEFDFFREFSSFCGMCLSAADFSGRFDIDVLFESDEFTSQKVPLKLQFDNRKSSSLFLLQFDAEKSSELELFKVVFSVFSKFELNEAFEIPNSQLFFFLKGIREKHNKVPFFNWRHAVDSLQFAAYMIINGNLDRLLSKENMLSLFVAVICQNAGHDNFEKETGTFSIEYEELLNRFCGFFEIEHSINSISVLTKSDSNIFVNINASQVKSIWDQIIELILSTDMSLHFTILNEFVSKTSTGEFDAVDSPLNKLLLMKILVKCADFCVFARPFDCADKFYGFLAEEFFRKGQIEKVEGLVFAAGKKARDEIDRSAATIGFLRSVALPLFQALTRQVKQLSLLADQVSENIDKYVKSMLTK